MFYSNSFGPMASALCRSPLMRQMPQQSQFALANLNTLWQLQTRSFVVRRQLRINRRLRKYRADKIQKESSFNKSEGKTHIHSFTCRALPFLLVQEEFSEERDDLQCPQTCGSYLFYFSSIVIGNWFLYISVYSVKSIHGEEEQTRTAARRRSHEHEH